MTGHGEAHRHENGLSIAVEIRTVNNRYFKLNLRLTDGYAPLEPHVELEQIESQWPRIEGVVSAALTHLAQMRIDEGRRMAADLATNSRAIATALNKVESRAPLVIDAYRGRLTERLNKLLAEVSV